MDEIIEKKITKVIDEKRIMQDIQKLNQRITDNQTKIENLLSYYLTFNKTLIKFNEKKPNDLFLFKIKSEIATFLEMIDKEAEYIKSDYTTGNFIDFELVKTFVDGLDKDIDTYLYGNDLETTN